MLLPLLLLLPLQGGPEEVRAALALSDYLRAWRLAEGQEDELLRARSTSEVLYRAGDPSGALARARGGLSAHPRDLELLLRATGAALWLESPELAWSYSEHLRLALEEARAELPLEEARQWNAAALDFEDRARELLHHEEARTRSVARTRAISIVVLAAILGVIAWISARGYGRSSRPVS